MNILFLEPFFSGSHATWLRGLREHSEHTITIASLKGRYWKWRMYGAAYTLATNAENLDSYDLIMATDMLNLSHFLALTRRTLPPDTPVGLYFHENQLTYPWQDGSRDKQLGRDLHYAFTNYNSALAADFLLFNSSWNMESFYGEMDRVLHNMPDHRHKKSIDQLRERSQVMPIGMDLKRFDTVEPKELGDTPLIIWNHRLEHDKNPQALLKSLLTLKKDQLPFKLVLMADVTDLTPKPVRDSLEALRDRIIHTGMLTSKEYAGWLKAGSIAPVTSHHDFFGISVMEAAYCGCYPLLPKRLTYPQLYDLEENPHLFYERETDLTQRLRQLVSEPAAIPRNIAHHLTLPYDWSNLAARCDVQLATCAARFGA